MSSRMLIAAPASGSGKTMVVCGLLEVLKQRGIGCTAFKCGPDYIDPLFHQYVQGVPGCNLDSFFLPDEGVLQLFAQRLQPGGLAVIEGVMGYYDGVAGTSTQASSYDIARITETPVILVVDGKKMSLSAAALIQGFLHYKADSRIGGVILNRTSEAMAGRLRAPIEALGIRFLGAVPECEAARLESRHLGLTLPHELKRLREKIIRLAAVVNDCLDIDEIIRLAAGAAPLKHPALQPRPDMKAAGRIGIARDEAFCFYYQENLDFLQDCGYELVPFSPLHDRTLPARLEAILLGGGYPELHAEALSHNQAMRKAIFKAPQEGIKILAECGGFLYLHRTLADQAGRPWPMAGIISAAAFPTSRLSRFGYIELTGTAGKIRAHEFHYWDSSAPGTAMLAGKPQSSRSWRCMYQTGNLLAGFPHLYYLSAPEFITGFLRRN